MAKSKKRAKSKKLLSGFNFSRSFIITILILFGLIGVYSIYKARAATVPIFSLPAPPLAPTAEAGVAANQVPKPGCRSKTLKVLVVGDSIARGMASVGPVGTDRDGLRLERELAKYGYCANVVNAAISASAVTDWTGPFRGSVASQKPDLIVAHFVGNQPRPGRPGPKWTDKNNAWWKANTEGLKQLDADAAALGVPIYWLVPNVAQYKCAPNLYVTALYRAFAKWQAANLTRPEQLINFRSVWGGDTYRYQFRFANGGGLVLRSNTVNGAADCLHYTDPGYTYLADSVRAVIYKEWLK